ncbi:phosphoribosylformylglycinamidine synthase subunit PurQ [Desulfothermus okinawensis JCM 13304]
MDNKKVKVLVLTGYGTNCDRESGYAAQIAGADEVIISHFSEIVQERVKIEDYNFLIFPGGFLDGDHLGAAQAAAIRIRYSKTKSGLSILNQIKKVHEDGGIILGICNGFQLLTKLGLLPASENNYFQRQVSLSYNDSARFEDRWVYLKVNPQCNCVFLKNIDSMYLPIRHGEGKVVPKNDEILKKLERQNLIALQYTDEKGGVTSKYPYNPNGSPLGIAGLTDPTGRILGLMPHPEAYNHPTNHPKWTRTTTSHEITGISIFRNGVEYLKRM